MSPRVQVRVAAAVAAVAGLTAAAAAARLTIDALAARHRRPHEQARVAELLAGVRREATVAPALQREYDRLTAESLAREARKKRLAYALLAAGGLFLFGAKRLVALRPVPPPRRVVALHVRAAPPAAPPARPAAGAARPHALPVAEPVDVTAVDEIVARTGRGPDAAVPILEAVQARYRYLPEPALRRVCALTDITPAQLAGVASFYTYFRRTPGGAHLVNICRGTACHVAGSAHIEEELRRRLQIPAGQDTDDRRQFTVQAVPCLGCCTLAPVVQIDGTTHGHTRPDAIPELLETATRPAGRQAGPPAAAYPGHPQPAGRPARPDSAGLEIRLGLGSCCIANGSGAVHAALAAALAAAGVAARVKRVGCVGMCHNTPLVEIRRPGRPPLRYARVRPEDAAAIVRRHLAPRGVARRARRRLAQFAEVLRSGAARPAAGGRVVELRDPPIAAFLGPQKHIATEHCGDLDPLDLDEYLAHDGFRALAACLRTPVAPEQVIALIEQSGLRGRGGAGYPTGRKWAQVRQAPGPTKYAICNGDEGDPGAFMDRMLMESYPYRVIEGLAIAAYAVGAAEGTFYIRAEYPLAVERIRQALRACEERGLLGDGLLGTGHHLRLHVVQGAGAFVCGEETALIATLEGRRGMPRLRPPYPSEHGLWGRPTLVNNVETLAVVPWILRHGPRAFAALGTAASRGTKVFALTGKVRRGGLIEVPMGVTIRQIVEQIGGGVRDGRRFKAVQVGGPSGGCLPAALADTPVDYEDLAAVGAIMGSGGLVVLDDTDCMVDIARYFLTFTQGQSCGKCVPCRVGTRRMLEILDRLCAGAGRSDDLDRLEALAEVTRQSSLCGLGRTAPNPVRTTLRYFRDEYEAHVRGRCPAGKCRALIRYAVTEACTGCTLCAQHCPAGAIALRPYQRHAIDAGTCTRCDACRTWCPEEAIEIV